MIKMARIYIQRLEGGPLVRIKKYLDMVRYEYIKHLGYYCTESSKHNAEYNLFFV